MCVAIPALIVSITPGPMTMGQVDQGGRRVDCCLAYVPDAEIGDYVLVQNGFAVQHLQPEAAQASLDAFAELGYPRRPDLDNRPLT
ncbi:MAG: HypC/HybG/HupF family hydrogenase formation chaperone [Nostocoides sp.]